MMVEKLSDEAPVDPDDELLVAYLDGELPRDERSALEKRLIDSGNLRLRLQQLQQGWELLGEMERSVPSNHLVESTLELAVLDVAPRPVRMHTSWIARYRWPLGILAACVIGAAATLLLISIVQARQYERQLRDLAIVENLDAYLYGSDLELMRQLAENQQWQNMVAASREISAATETTIDTIAHLSNTPVAEREAMIAKLPLDKRAELKSRWERFKLLTPDARDRIRETAEIVSQQTDSEKLLQTMSSYAHWRESISSTELRDKIQSDDPAVRRAAIAEAIQQTQIELAERSGYMLDEETLDQIYLVLQQITRKRVEEGDAQIKETFARFVRTYGREKAIDEALRATMFGSNEILGDYTPERLSDAEINWIRIWLPPNALETLAAVSGGDPWAETITIELWAIEAVRRRYRQAESATPLERYQAMNPTDREVLDLLPPEQLLEQLTQ